jgi:hypothetical protein
VFQNHLDTTSNLIAYLNGTRQKSHARAIFKLDDLMKNPHKAIHSAVISNLANADAYGMPASLAIYADGEGAFMGRLNGAMPRDYARWLPMMKGLQAETYVPTILSYADEVRSRGFENFVVQRELKNIAGGYKKFAIQQYEPGKEPRKPLETFAKLRTILPYMPNQRSWEREIGYLTGKILKGEKLDDSYYASK